MYPPPFPTQIRVNPLVFLPLVVYLSLVKNHSLIHVNKKLYYINIAK